MSRKGTKFNYNFFDEIDTEEKAYWLGFIWCDGYLSIRDRKNNGTLSYSLNMRLGGIDEGHLIKLNNSLEGEYKVTTYICKPNKFNKEPFVEAKLLITNKHLGETLSQKYGMIPHRVDSEKIEALVPRHLFKHFARGVIDGDGSFTKYNASDRGRISTKYTLSIATTPDLVSFIHLHLVEENIIDDVLRKKEKRREGKTYENYTSIRVCGYRQVKSALDYLYKDATIYLDRKYEKYIKMFEEEEK